MNEAIEMRANMLASFYAAVRVAGGNAERMPLTAATVAGALLHASRTTHDASEMCRLVLEYLRELADAEGAATLPPQSLAAGGRR